MASVLSSISEAIEDVRTGKLLIIVDDDDRYEHGYA
jgi:3,4-dihydroxy-2-butanone 4-phosphate synthase